MKTTFYHLVRFHLGSVCLGSMVLTIVKIFKLILNKLRYQCKKNPCCLCSTCCISCCIAYVIGKLMDLFERFLKYLIRNAYIIIAMDGTPLVESGRKAFNLIMDNTKDVIAINKFGDTVLVMAKLFIVLTSSLLAYYSITVS